MYTIFLYTQVLGNQEKKIQRQGCGLILSYEVLLLLIQFILPPFPGLYQGHRPFIVLI